jgi:hypothetical protein
VNAALPFLQIVYVPISTRYFLGIITLLQLDDPVVQELVLIDQAPHVIDQPVHFPRDVIVQPCTDFVEGDLNLFANPCHNL